MLVTPDAVHTQASNELSAQRRREVLSFAAHAVRLDADKIGWLPYQFYDDCDQAGSLVSVTRDGDLVGFCAFRRPNWSGESKIIQTWVREDARMIEHGRALVARVEEIAAGWAARWLSCWVAQDLAAMRFWPAIGFVPVQQRLGRGDICDLRGRRLLTQFWRRIPAPPDPGVIPP